MSKRPIIFSAPMIRALLDGRKTQTRRLAWRPMTAREIAARTMPPDCEPTLETPWTRVQPGDRLWVREPWRTADEYHHLSGAKIPANDRRVIYDGRDGWVAWDIGGVPGRARAARFMPRWASRLTLTVTEVRRQRLQEISYDDCRDEGAICHIHGPVRHTACRGLRESFEDTWDRLHGEGAWAANPEVVALTFTVARRNIDARDAA